MLIFICAAFINLVCDIWALNGDALQRLKKRELTLHILQMCHVLLQRLNGNEMRIQLSIKKFNQYLKDRCLYMFVHTCIMHVNGQHLHESTVCWWWKIYFHNKRKKTWGEENEILSLRKLSFTKRRHKIKQCGNISHCKPHLSFISRGTEYKQTEMMMKKLIRIMLVRLGKCALTVASSKLISHYGLLYKLFGNQ